MPALRTTVIALVLAALLCLGVPNQAVACPNCKEAVSATSSESANMADGFNWSVLLMLAVPLSLAGTGALLVRRAVKQGTFPEM
jgi:hypothetical protein